MHVSKTVPSSPPSETVSPLCEGISVLRESGVTSERVPFDADELIHIPLSNKAWELYLVPADQIESINSDWERILSAPRIHIAGKSDGTYRVAIHDSYIQRLYVSSFRFHRDLHPLKPLDEEVSIHGVRVATRNAIACYHRDALKAISSRRGPWLDDCYRMVLEFPHQEALEWAILLRDLALNDGIKIGFINEKMRTFLACVLDIQWPVLDPFHEFSDQYWICRMRDGFSHKGAHKMAIAWPAKSGEEAMFEEVAILDEQESGVTTTDECLVLVKTQREESVASPTVSDDKHCVPAFPRAVFYLEAYKLVYVCLPKVSPHEKILSTINLLNGSLAVIVLGSYVLALERDLDTICFPYNFEPSREDVELLGFVEAQNQQVDAFARMAVDAMLRDNTLEKGLWICADPLCILNLFTTWLREGDSPAFLEPTGISNSESGRVQLDGYNFHSYTLVGVSNIGQHVQNLDKLGNFDKILSIEELEDESWELSVRKSYLPILKDKLCKMVPECIIKLDYDPTEPNAKEVEEFGYERARILRTIRFHDRAEHMMRESWPKAAAFYADLAMGGEKEIIVLDNDEKEMEILENEEQGEEEMVEESTGEDWVMVQTL